MPAIQADPTNMRLRLSPKCKESLRILCGLPEGLNLTAKGVATHPSKTDNGKTNDGTRRALDLLVTLGLADKDTRFIKGMGYRYCATELGRRVNG